LFVNFLYILVNQHAVSIQKKHKKNLFSAS